jgi:hypothetical protein
VDGLTGEDHRDKTIGTPGNAILIVDSVFAFRPEYNDCWEYRIWLEVAPGVAFHRGTSRDTAAEGIGGSDPPAPGPLPRGRADLPRRNQPPRSCQQHYQ